MLHKYAKRGRNPTKGIFFAEPTQSKHEDQMVCKRPQKMLSVLTNNSNICRNISLVWSNKNSYSVQSSKLNYNQGKVTITTTISSQQQNAHCIGKVHCKQIKVSQRMHESV